MNSNFCICCGEEIPEGRMVCPSCEKEENLSIRKKKKMVTEAPLYEPSRYHRNQKHGRKK